MTSPRGDARPASYAVFRLFLTCLFVAGLGTVVVLTWRYDVGPWLVAQETRLWRSLRDSVVPW